QQQAELQWQRAPYVALLDSDPAFKRKLMAAMIDEVGTGGTDEALASVVETLFNRAAQAGAQDLNVKGLLGGPDQENYYQGFRTYNGSALSMKNTVYSITIPTWLAGWIKSSNKS